MKRFNIFLVYVLAAISLAADLLDNEGIKHLVKAGLSDQAIQLMIRTKAGHYDTSVPGIIDLKKNGVSEPVIEEILKTLKPAPEKPSTRIEMTGAAPTASAPPVTGTGGASEYVFTALLSGHNYRSRIKIENQSAAKRTYAIEAYRRDGSLLFASASVDLSPKEVTDIPISVGGWGPHYSWARVMLKGDKSGVIVQAFVEVQHGERKEQIKREPEILKPGLRWVHPANEAEGKVLYFVNVGGPATIVAVCQSHTYTDPACRDTSPRVSVKPHETFVYPVGKMKDTYVLVESSTAVAAAASLVWPQKGTLTNLLSETGKPPSPGK